ncbi:MAG: copper resistance CopC/CopD family protein, partial [Pseudorhodoplanes sp.]
TAGLLSASPAFAHATLLRSEPAAGTVIGHAPSEIKLVFNEPVSPLVFQLLAPQKGRLPLSDVKARDAEIRVALPQDLEQGTHVLSWRVVSADGHPVGGSFPFSIGVRTEASGTIEQNSGMAARAALFVTRIVLYLGLLVGIGGAFYRATIAQEGRLASRATQLAQIVLVSGVLGAMLSVGLQGLDALARPLADIVAGDVWKTGLATSYRRTAEFATWAMIASLLSMQVQSAAIGRALAVIGILGGGAALAASGHASNAPPQWLARGAVFGHAIGLTMWIGALMPLFIAARAGGDAFVPELKRFSRAIPLAVVIIVAAGLILVMLQVDRPAALWSTGYGLVLCSKLAAVAILFALAGVNRFRLTRRMIAGEGRARQLFARIVRWEIAFAVIVLATVALWRFTPPPRVLALAAVQPVFVHIHTPRAMAEFSLRPVRGEQSLTLQLLDGEFEPLSAKEVRLALSSPDNGIEPLRFDAAPAEGAGWRVDRIILPAGGRWHARIDVLVNDFETLALEDTFDLPPEPLR